MKEEHHRIDGIEFDLEKVRKHVDRGVERSHPFCVQGLDVSDKTANQTFTLTGGYFSTEDSKVGCIDVYDGKSWSICRPGLKI